MHRHAVHVVTLGSRKSLCVNDSVRGLASVGLINERCLDMRRRQTSAKARKRGEGSTASTLAAARRHCRCSYASPGTDALFAQGCRGAGRVLDLEELIALGKQMHACPYYGVRRAARRADVVCLPYNMLFQAEARRSLGVRGTGISLAVNMASTFSST